jgi:hypothetical protein
MRTRLPTLPGGALLWAVLAWPILPAVPAIADDKPPDPAAVEFFEKKVRPVLAENCHRCHSTQASKLRGGLLLDSRAGVLKGGDNGPAVVPGEPDRSRLVLAVRYTDVNLRMPPRGKLPDAAVADLAAWVKMGAPWPAGDAPKGPVAGAGFDLPQRKRSHWAWRPVRPQDPPAVRDREWPRTAEDRFILAKLEAKGLAPAPPADRRTLLRRVSFDLVGLPPSPAEVEAFVQDESANAYEKAVDRLLASPHFGERWARHWLDLVRYAETRGHEYDYPLPNAFQYRDYVIRAFNADVPYNQFVTEHIAGDLLDRPRLDSTEGFNESILGTGFWFLGEEVHSPVDLRQDESDRFDNRIDVMTKTFLGLTVACARCHDHKFDAIAQTDYYALFGILEGSGYRLARFDSMAHNRQVADDLQKLRARARPALQRALADGMRPVLGRLADYLLAAREVLLSETSEERLPEIARSHKLDPALLEQWVAHLTAAAKDPANPLHAWAKLAADPAAKDPKRLADLLRPLVEGWRKRQTEAAAALTGAEVVIDYARAGAGDWLPDGPAFGPGPVRPGDVRLSTDPARPILRVCDTAAAEKDPTWDLLRAAPGSENDTGALGVSPRAGRTIRTPAFTVTSGKLWYLVRGAGRAYAAVDQHVMIAGPLHAQLVLPFPAGDRFRWVMHDLTPYKGQRAHVEFTADASDLAVALVVQAVNAPGLPDRPNEALLHLLADAGSVEALAAGYERLFAGVADRLAADRIIDSADAADCARLADWLLRHPELFTPADGGAARHVAEVAAPFLAEQGRLVARIKPESRLALAMLDGSGVDENVFIRGSPKNPGPVVPRRFLEALAGASPLPREGEGKGEGGSGRLQLARQMTDPALDPFLARVIVNRAWHHLFGRGIVASVDNFGVLGEPPTHPELLDYLADDFVKQGWSLKKLIRELVLSSTYRMASRPDAHADQADPQDLLLHRMRLRRLEGEAIRDAMLTLSGRLNDRVYGPPVPVYLTEFQDGRGRPVSGPLDGDGRRSVYLAVRRNFLSPLLLAFDTPTPFSTVGRRTVSNVPAQALILMNDPFVHLQAELWAKGIMARGGRTEERITAMYRGAFARPPSADELRFCLEFLDQQHPSGDKRDDPAAWADLAHVLFNAKEFIFLN